MSQQSLFELEPTPILLSLEKRYWDSIVEGVKRIEYRRLFRQEPTRSFIITSRSDNNLVGWFETAPALTGSPEEIAALAESVYVGHGSAVLEYLKGARRGYAAPIIKVYRGHAMSLREIRKVVPALTVPQSYILVNKNPPLKDLLSTWAESARLVWEKK